jgi:molybdopterin molybdotransferase
MITHEEAFEIVINSIQHKNKIEKVTIFNCLHRILACDIESDINMPPFDKSAMDGYACRFEDRKEPLTVIEVIPAGKLPTRKIERGLCSKIMTGAMLPEGADFVIKVEDIKEIDQNSLICTEFNNARNICFLGEDIKQNTILLKKGTKINPQHLAVLATAGKMEVDVYAKTTIGIISTGDELTEPNLPLNKGKIRNSNSYQLYGQALKQGATPSYYGIALDTKESLQTIILEATSENQIVILTGGVSMGDFDYVPQALKELEFNILFKSIAVQPGKPTLFGKNRDSFCFGLPGNPVSSFIQFELLVSPLIQLLQGENIEPYNTTGVLKENYSRKNTSRKAWIPVYLNTEMEISQISYHGSAHINAFTEANAIMEIPIGVSEINKGGKAHVRRLP